MLYTYTAIIARSAVKLGKVTFNDRRKLNSDAWIPLDSQAITGHVAGYSATQAKERAIAEVKQRYPEERGYRNHDNVTVRAVPD